MADWKKLVVSGSNISQLNNDSAYLTAATAAKAFATASANGISLLADSSAGNLTFSASSATGVYISASEGNDTLTFSLGSIPNSSLTNPSITLGSTSINLGATGSSIAGLILTEVTATGSFSGSFVVSDNIFFPTSKIKIDGGGGAVASGVDSVAIGNAPQATGDNSVAIGYNPHASTNGVSLGYNSKATGTDSIALGYAASTRYALENENYTNAIAIGGTANARGDYSIAIGDTAIASGSYGINIGNVFYGNGSTGDAFIPSGSLTVADSISASSFSGSFSGSFQGDGSLLTGIASNLAVSGSTGNGSVALKTQALSIVGTSLEVETSVSGQTVTIGLPSDVTIANDLTVTGDLFVNGTTTQINTTELLVEDKFILLASGSATAGDAGIIIDRGSDAAGNVAYGFDSATGRWGFQNGLTDTTNAIAIGTDGNSAFVGHVFTEAAHTSAPTTGEFVTAGAIYTATSGDIFIYS